MPAVAAWPYKRNKAAIQTQIEEWNGEEHMWLRRAWEEWQTSDKKDFLGENPQPACGFAQFAAGYYSRNLGINKVSTIFYEIRLTATTHKEVFVVTTIYYS